MSDRKIGNISKDMYVDYHLRGESKNVAEADFEIMYSIVEKIQEMCGRCRRREAECGKNFVTRGQALIVGGFLVGILVGLQIIGIHELVDVIPIP